MTAQEIKDAEWAARLHVETNTMLSDKAILDVCKALLVQGKILATIAANQPK